MTAKPKKVKIPTVVLDIDDTIVQFLGFLCFLFNSKHETSITEADLTEWNFTSTRVQDALGRVVEGTELRQFFEQYETHGLYAAIPPIRESVLAMRLMKSLGYKIILMTARKEQFAKDTEINFITNSIPYDEIIFGADKVKEINRLARTHHIVIFADDKFDYVKGVFETDKVEACYLINKAHNKGVGELGDIKRVDDLLEIIRHLPSASKPSDQP